MFNVKQILNFKAFKIENSNNFFYSLDFNVLNNTIIKNCKFIKFVFQNKDSFNKQFENKFLSNEKDTKLNKFTKISNLFSQQINNTIVNNNLLFSVENKRNSENKIFQYEIKNKNKLDLSFKDSQDILTFSNEKILYCFIYFLDEFNNINYTFEISENFEFLYNNAQKIDKITYYSSLIKDYLESFELFYKSDSDNILCIRNKSILQLTNSDDIKNIELILSYKNIREKTVKITNINQINLYFDIMQNINKIKQDLLFNSDLIFNLTLKYKIVNSNFNNFKNFTFKKNDCLYKELYKNNSNDFISLILNNNIDNCNAEYIEEDNIFKLTIGKKNINQSLKSLSIKSIKHNNIQINNIYYEKDFKYINKFYNCQDKIINNGQDLVVYYFADNYRYNNNNPDIKIEFCLLDENDFVLQKTKYKECLFIKNEKIKLFNDFNIISDFNKLIKQKIIFEDTNLNLDFSIKDTFNSINKIKIKNINDFEKIAFNLNYINFDKGDIRQLFKNTVIKIKINNLLNEKIQTENVYHYLMSELFNLEQVSDSIESNDLLSKILINQKIKRNILNSNIKEINILNNNKQSIFEFIQKEEINYSLKQQIQLEFYPLYKDILLYKNKGFDKLNNIINDNTISDEQKNIINTKFYNLFYYYKKVANLNYDIFDKIKKLYCENDPKNIVKSTKLFYENLFIHSFNKIINNDDVFKLSYEYKNEDIKNYLLNTTGLNLNSTKIVDINEYVSDNIKQILDLNIKDNNLNLVNFNCNYELINTKNNDINFKDTINIFASSNKIKINFNQLLSDYNISEVFNEYNEIDIKCLLFPVLENDKNNNIYFDNKIIKKQIVENKNYFTPSEDFFIKNNILFNDFFIGYKYDLNNFDINSENNNFIIDLDFNSSLYKNFLKIEYNTYLEFFNYCKTNNIILLNNLCIRILLTIKIKDKLIEKVVHYNLINDNNQTLNNVLDLNKITFQYN